MATINKKVKIISNDQGCCPYCNSDNIHYGTWQLEGDMGYYPSHCYGCSKDFEEWYSLTFNGHNVGDGCCIDAADVLGQEIEMEVYIEEWEEV